MEEKNDLVYGTCKIKDFGDLEKYVEKKEKVLQILGRENVEMKKKG